jgi:hypothetical protein
MTQIETQTRNYIEALYREAQCQHGIDMGYQYEITYRNMTGRKNSYKVIDGDLLPELSELLACGFRIIRISRI